MTTHKCPLCGCEAQVHREDEGNNYAGGTAYRIQCEPCKLSTTKEYTESKAEDAWNVLCRDIEGGDR